MKSRERNRRSQHRKRIDDELHTAETGAGRVCTNFRSVQFYAVSGGRMTFEKKKRVEKKNELKKIKCSGKLLHIVS